MVHAAGACRAADAGRLADALSAHRAPPLRSAAARRPVFPAAAAEGARQRRDDVRFPCSLAQPLEGRRIGPYEVTSRIGAGGMGEVYLAPDPRLDRLAAIKVLAG